MNNYKKTAIAAAIRKHSDISSSIAVSLVLASSTASHAAVLPDLQQPKSHFRQTDSVVTRELLFVDATVADSAQLLLNLRPNIELVVLEQQRDGLEQITEVLRGRRDITAVHIVAHGEPGSMQLGSTHLSGAQLSARAEELEQWFVNDAAARPDLLLYSCNVAQGEAGNAFVAQLARYTGADVAASDDVTGAGGDWDLEVHAGYIETEPALTSANAGSYPYRLATFTVTKTADTDDGTCDADCSLREAIDAANGAGGADIIAFAGGVTGTITLTLGQIDITDELTINGPGSGSLAISGNNSSRIFDIQDDTTIRDLTLRDGDASDGGAISNNGNNLTIEDSVITNNSADTDGGAIYQDEGYLTIRRTEISNNYAGEDGGGIAFYMDDDDDILRVEDSLITNNTARYDGGGIFAYADDEGGTVYIDNSTISNNDAYDDGGGIFFYSDDDGYLVVSNSTISGNNARDGGDGGGIFFYSDDGRLTIDQSTISNNYAYDNGGGIAIEETSYTTIIRNSTIVFNESYYYGGGISQEDGDIYLYNTIVAENESFYSGGHDIYSNGNYVYSRYSLVGDDSDANVVDRGGTILNTASGVSPVLANAGGLNEVHQLLAGSPAINAGEPGPSPQMFDQRGSGFPRILDGRLDIGAVESGASAAPAAPLEVPVLPGWALWILGLLLPGVAARYRRRSDKR